MGQQLENINANLADWIARQQIFFVATAPLEASGHVNLSPKGGDALRVLGPLEVAYQDYTGSGAETAAHIRQNGRIVIMLCAFDGPPKIIRLHGQGTLISPDNSRYAELAAKFPPHIGSRAFVHVAVTRVSQTCGTAVPFFDFRERRNALDDWAIAQGPEKLHHYRLTKNQHSIDGLPAFDAEAC